MWISEVWGSLSEPDDKCWRFPTSGGQSQCSEGSSNPTKRKRTEVFPGHGPVLSFFFCQGYYKCSFCRRLFYGNGQITVRKLSRHAKRASPVICCESTIIWIVNLGYACHASSYGPGAVLSHVMEDEQERLVSYASRTLSSSEKNYPQIEKKAYF